MKHTARKVGRRLRAGPLGDAATKARARMARGVEARTLLLVSDRSVYTSEQQFAPIRRFSGRIAGRYGLIAKFCTLDEARAMSTEALRSHAAIGLKLDFRTPSEAAGAIAGEILGRVRGTATRALVFDGDDDLSVLWPDMLGRCDLYIKKHAYADVSDYTQARVGKSNLTDYVATEFGTSFADNIIPRSGGIDAAEAARIVVGWNIALDDKIHDLSRDLPPPDAATKDIDLSCRASVAPDVWTYPMRNAAVEALRTLDGRWRVHAPVDRVPQAEYYREMMRSRMSVSPYGFGELCWRDFECILCGAVLVKPDMSHLRTAPDLFVPGETYVPVAWDFSNLEAVCEPYLKDEARRARMADRARAILLEALGPDWFLDRFGEVMRRAGVLST
ncbi:glycosyltransferase [uncultured Jannaschia sp.]|uniref:glycosyltransferase family protein n=1 Tax=uncultured Jannaschia sp. TaxID=293347 RepID=UPI00262040BB|nr:glycosyltransferase [uncultured Jannaschia sp.]